MKSLLKFSVTSAEPPGKRPDKEFVVGDDVYRDRNKWVEKFRAMDRKDDQYIEIVTDPETGETIRRCVEKLSDHRGHGSDKG